MKKTFLQKNLLRDMFERSYAVCFLGILLLLAWEAVWFLLLKASANPESDYPIRLFSGLGTGIAVGAVVPFLLVWFLLQQYASPEARDVFYSLPTTRRSIFGSTAVISFGYLAVYLLADTVMMALIFAFSKEIRVEEGYFPIKIAIIALMFLFYYGIAMICFSLSSGLLWYGIFSLTWMFLIYKSYSLIMGLPVWRYLYHGGLSDMDRTASEFLSDLAGKRYAGYVAVSERAVDLWGEAADMTNVTIPIGQYFWNAAPILLLIGVIALGLGYLAFVFRKAERVEGKSKSRIMHIALQCAVTLYILLNAVENLGFTFWYSETLTIPNLTGIGIVAIRAEYFGKVRPIFRLFPEFAIPYISVIIAGLIIWEMIYQKSIYKFWKASAGILAAIIAVGLIELYVVL